MVDYHPRTPTGRSLSVPLVLTDGSGVLARHPVVTSDRTGRSGRDSHSSPDLFRRGASCHRSHLSPCQVIPRFVVLGGGGLPRSCRSDPHPLHPLYLRSPSTDTHPLNPRTPSTDPTLNHRPPFTDPTLHPRPPSTDPDVSLCCPDPAGSSSPSAQTPVFMSWVPLSEPLPDTSFTTPLPVRCTRDLCRFDPGFLSFSVYPTPDESLSSGGSGGCPCPHHRRTPERRDVRGRTVPVCFPVATPGRVCTPPPGTPTEGPGRSLRSGGSSGLPLSSSSLVECLPVPVPPALAPPPCRLRPS